MYRPGKIMKSGRGPTRTSTARVYNSDGGTAVIDMNAATPAWRTTASMAFRRSYQNMTLLPDGTVLASGGMTTSDGTDLSKAVLPAEIWNPDTETWTTVAPLQNGREYHSTALLLPDGRVLMAGGGRSAAARPTRRTPRSTRRRTCSRARGRRSRPRRRRARLRDELRRLDAERGADREGLAHPLAVGDARVRPEPALPVPQLHGRAPAS